MRDKIHSQQRQKLPRTIKTRFLRFHFIPSWWIYREEHSPFLYLRTVSDLTLHKGRGRYPLVLSLRLKRSVVIIYCFNSYYSGRHTNIKEPVVCCVRFLLHTRLSSSVVLGNQSLSGVPHGVSSGIAPVGPQNLLTVQFHCCHLDHHPLCWNTYILFSQNSSLFWRFSY